MAARTQTQARSNTAIKQAMARKQQLLDTFVERLLEETYAAFREMDGVASHNLVIKFSLPNQASATSGAYWSGSDSADSTKNGIPIVMLLQGERDRETGKLHPERLPGGKTAIQLLNERLVVLAAPCSVELLFDKRSKELEVYVFDHERVPEWEDFKTKKPRQQFISSQPPMMDERRTISDYMPASAQKEEPPAEDDDGFQEVRRRRK